MSKRRLLVLRAGSPSGNNLIRSLKAGDKGSFVVGCHDDPFTLKKSVADRNYLIPGLARDGYARALRHIVKAERIDLIIPNSDPDVLAVARLSGRLVCRVYLPRLKAIERCQDKYELTRFLKRRGIPVPATRLVGNLDEIEKIFGRFASHETLWCRARRGAGSLGALPVASPRQARGWIRYWEEVHGMPPGSFTLSEYLPGRDLMVQCLFKNGTPIMAKMFDRLSYHTLNAIPSGVSSTAAVSHMVFEQDVVQMCIKAMLALDPKASAIFFADLKENIKGEACITEINAGRFSNMPTIHDLTGADNMCATYVRAAFDEHIEAREPCGYADDCYVMRGLDAAPVVLKTSELFEGFEDAR